MATNIDFQKHNIPFTMVANAVLEDINLSLGAKAIYAFLYSKPDGWQFSADRIGKDLGVERKKILRHLEELKSRDYLISQRLPSGRMLYKVILPPIEPQATVPKEDLGSKATVPKSLSTKMGLVSNTILNTSNTISISNKLDIQTSSLRAKKVPQETETQTVNAGIYLFKDLDLVGYSALFKRKAEREAIENLIKQRLNLPEMIAKAKVYNTLPFVSERHKIYSPTSLLRNWQKVLDKEQQIINELALHSEKGKITNRNQGFREMEEIKINLK